MREFLNFLGDAILDRSADDLIGALVLACFAGVAATSLHRLLQARVPNSGMLLAGLVILVNFACMISAAGYALKADRDARILKQREVTPTPPGATRSEFSMDDEIARRLMKSADSDGDGALSPEEARTAVDAIFVDLPRREDGGVDVPRLSSKIRRAFFPPRPTGDSLLIRSNWETMPPP